MLKVIITNEAECFTFSKDNDGYYVNNVQDALDNGKLKSKVSLKIKF